MKTPCLIVATSGRALARSARRGGYPVFVLDLFADRDTRRYASACRQVPARGWDFDAAATIAAAGEFSPPKAALVTGSGFEANPELIASLARGRRLCGNSPATVAATKDPARFFPLLDTLAIAHPETRTAPPPCPDGWLVKSVGGSGGSHVRRARAGEAARPGAYFQRQLAGTSASVLFLADGRRATIVGCNAQWAAGGGEAPFCYGGAINRVELPASTRRRLAAELDALVARLGLVGLNGMDFIVDGEDYAVLEINPRPTATLELHDDDHPGGLFDLHLRACRGELPATLPASPTVRAHAVVYAGKPLRLAADYRFPAWCRDLPEPASGFAAGMPVCSVHAAGASTAAVRQLVEQRRSRIENDLMELAA